MGTNRLIRDGATLVRSVEDITAEFEFLFPKDTGKKRTAAAAATTAPAALDESERMLFEALLEPMSLDDLAEKTDVSIEKVTTAMLMLELKGIVRCLPGKIYDRK
jgi:DNA processing protein